MSSTVLYMSMSLDGYIAGPNDEPGNPGGDDFMRLHEWYGFEGCLPTPRGPAGARILWTRSRRLVRSLRAGALLSRSITGVEIITASRSSCQVTAGLDHPSRNIPW